jgi:hypothetical protein
MPGKRKQVPVDQRNQTQNTWVIERIREIYPNLSTSAVCA